MPHRQLRLILVAIAFALFWSAVIAEVTLRYASESFSVLFVLSVFGLMVASFLGYRVAIRNSVGSSKSSGPNNQTRSSSQTRRRRSTKSVQQQNTATKTRSPRPRDSTRSSQRPPVSPKSGTDRAPSEKQPDSIERVSGQVRVYFPKLAYGFIEDTSGVKAFFHKNSVDSALSDKDLTRRPKVTFELVSGERGPVANNIRTAE